MLKSLWYKSNAIKWLTLKAGTLSTDEADCLYDTNLNVSPLKKNLRIKALIATQIESSYKLRNITVHRGEQMCSVRLLLEFI